jgi:hypothetical protein
MSGYFCESQEQGSREFLSHLKCSRFDRDSVDLARSVGVFDESSYRPTTDVRSRSAEIPSLLLNSVGSLTSGFPILVLSLIDDRIADAVGADARQSAGVQTVWISLGAVFAVLLVVGAIILVVLVVHRRRPSLAQTDETETDDAIPVDGESPMDDLRDFVSGENALSHDRGLSAPKPKDDTDESFDSKVAGRPDLPERHQPE